jgi:predicted SprT family Zn-dependent metalloprotease
MAPAMSAAMTNLGGMSELVQARVQAQLQRVQGWAHALIALHLDPRVWSFGFDNAKRRAGQCDHQTKRITVSRYFVAEYDDDEIHQVLLHEVAHALAGPRAGHGPRWRAIADELGYVGKTTVDKSVADDLAPWVGTCPRGHVHYRYRRPSRDLSCGKCSRRFSREFLIEWVHRPVARRVG